MRAQALLTCLLLLLLSGCGATGETTGTASRTEAKDVTFFAMDTVMSVRAFGADDALLSGAEPLVTELEAELSATREGSAVYTLNRTGSVTLSEEGAYLLDRALALCRETGGALDVSVYPVVRAWGFTTADGNYRVPDAAELSALLERVDYTRVTLEGNSASLPEGMELDLGAVAKGYAGDRIAAYLKDAGVESALLDLGGNVQTVGKKPDGSDWRIAVQNPDGEGVLGVLAVSDQAVITSGGYERYFIDDAGTLRWHIMDPRSGYPARNGLISVTVVGDEGLYCDALSTALFVMGTEDAVAFWRGHRDFDMILVTEDGTLLLTPGLATRFAPSEGLAYETAVIGDA